MGKKIDCVAYVLLSRGMPFTIQLDGLAKAIQSIKPSQEKMEKSIEHMIGLFKTMKEKMDKKFEKLHVNLNNSIEEIKRKQPTSSSAQKTNNYIVSMSFKL